MLINPQQAITEGWFKFPDWMDEQSTQESIQPNAIDFTVDRIFRMDGPCVIGRNHKQMRSTVELIPVTNTIDNGHSEARVDDSGKWCLDSHSVYDGLSDAYIDLPSGVAAILVPRSTFSRNGIFITSGLWDSGFRGHLGMAIHNRSDEASIEVHTRIGQVMFVSSDSAGLYTGGYNHVRGTDWKPSNVEDRQ